MNKEKINKILGVALPYLECEVLKNNQEKIIIE